MSPTDPQSARQPEAGKRRRYAGEVVYVHAFDVAYELGRQPIRQLLGHPVAQFNIDSSRRNPRHLSFFRPQMVRLAPQERLGPHGPVRVERIVKILPVGAITITVRVPYSVERLEDLIVYHDLQFSNGALHDEVRQLAEEIRRELSPFVLRPIEQMPDEEAYTVFCIESPLTGSDGAVVSSEAWLESHRRSVAALLTQEPQLDRLSRQESDESTGRYLSYYEHDLVVIDWDAALIVDRPGSFEETLYIMELANLQLTELEAYDSHLDLVLERSYRDLGTNPLRSRPQVLRELRELRIDMARFDDELRNITKFFGDWHLARIYESVSARFHLQDWHRSVDEKLKTMDDLYQLLKHDQMNRWMMILEVTIVLLFIIDLVILFVGVKK